MSDALLAAFPDPNISGAAHRRVELGSSEVLTSELESRAMVARPKSAIRAFPDPSTMIFGWGP